MHVCYTSSECKEKGGSFSLYYKRGTQRVSNCNILADYLQEDLIMRKEILMWSRKKKQNLGFLKQST